jgi:hypothetical protein
MHPFDYVLTLLSFVYALAIAHVLATVGDLMSAGNRVRFSWLNAAWMLYAFLAALIYWVNMWDLRTQPAWNMGLVAIFFAISSMLYLEIRLVCLRVPIEGAVDMAGFHEREGWKYMAGFAVLAAFTVLLNVFYWQGGIAALAHSRIDWVVLAQCIASSLGACFSNRRMQAAVAVVVGLMWVWFWFFLVRVFT